MSIRCVVAFAGAALSLGSASLAQSPAAIYSTVTGQANSNVPGIAGLRFSSFDRPQGSQSGINWIMLARTDSGSTANDALYLTGAGALGAVRVREGVTEIEPGRTAENMSDRRVSILDDGRYGLSLNLTGATTDDQVGVLGNGPGLSVEFREGQPIAGIGGTFWGSAFGDTTIDTTGKLAVRATSLGGLPATANAAVLLKNGDISAAQRGFTIPSGGVSAQTINTFAFGSVYTSADASSVLYKADLNGPTATNQILAVNNAIRIQEGVALSGLPSTVSNIISENMTANGDWFARGENLDDQAWIVRNGVTIATSGAVVPGGLPGESWSNVPWNVANGNTFGLHTGNSLGDFIIGGFTNTADTTRQYAIVLNNSTVVLREGDAVDLNGDGLLNDDAFYDVTGLTGASLDNKVSNFFLTDDLWLYGIIDLRNSAGADIGEAFVRFQIPTPGAALSLGALAGLITRRRRAV